jgi:F1F0 ATPase subunit 2
MSEGFYFVSALFMGLALGLVYFGGLWLTIRMVYASNHPSLLFCISFFLRNLTSGVCFYFIITMGSLAHLLVSLAGVILMRTLLMRYLRNQRLKINRM